MAEFFAGILFGFILGIVFIFLAIEWETEEQPEQIPENVIVKPIIHVEEKKIRPIFAELELPLEELARHPSGDWVSEQLKWKLMDQAWHYTKVEQTDTPWNHMRRYRASLLVVEAGRLNPLIGERSVR